MTDPDYARLRADRPELFANPPGAGLEILAEVPSTGGPFGVVYQDRYVTVLRDPVRFPGGRIGGYVRLVHTAPAPGAVVLPLLAGQLVLLRHFRHATRDWHLEAPRGFGEPGRSPEQVARHEVREELGATCTALTPLGSVHPDSGLLSGRVELFLARISVPDPASVEIEEASPQVVMTAEALGAAIRDGAVTDAFTIAAYTRAWSRGLLP